MKNVTAAPKRLPAPVIPSHNKSPKRNLKPDNGTLGIIVAVGFVGVIACINSAVKSVSENTRPVSAPVAVTRVVPVAITPVNPLGGWVQKGRTNGDDMNTWFCHDPESEGLVGEIYRCDEFKGMTKTEARRAADKWQEHKRESAAQETAREEYGKATYGNCPWTGCRGL